MTGGWDAVWNTGSSSEPIDPPADVSTRDEAPLSARTSAVQVPTPTEVNDVVVLRAMLEDLRQDVQRHHDDVKRNLQFGAIALCVVFALVYRSMCRIEQRRWSPST